MRNSCVFIITRLQVTMPSPPEIYIASVKKIMMLLLLITLILLLLFHPIL